METVTSETVTYENVLGVTLNYNLSWEEHLNCFITKVNSKFALLRHIKGCLPIGIRKLFSNSHILPYVEFYSNVWGNPLYVKDLFLAQKSVDHTMLGIKDKAIRSPENRTCNLLSHLNWMCIHDRIN